MSTAFCVTTPSSLVYRYQYYRQMCCPHLQSQVSKKVPIKCWPIYQATWCHIPYSMLFQAVLAVMFLTCAWEWSNFNSGCDMSDFKDFHNIPQSMEENSTSVPQLRHGQFHSNSSRHLQCHNETQNKNMQEKRTYICDRMAFLNL
jgi:hypothetical protein